MIRTAMNEESMGSDKRYVEREQIADIALYLCSDAARAITGQVIRLDA
jgi:enoyl-[acyl-carrier-protein] reductase (NADH)